jgi:hypothetical protein
MIEFYIDCPFCHRDIYARSTYTNHFLPTTVKDIKVICPFCKRLLVIKAQIVVKQYIVREYKGDER